MAQNFQIFWNNNSQLDEPLKDVHSKNFDDQEISGRLGDVNVLHKNKTAHIFGDDFKDHIEGSVANIFIYCSNYQMLQLSDQLIAKLARIN